MRYLRKFTGDDITSDDLASPTLEIDMSEIPSFSKNEFPQVTLDDLPIRVKTRFRNKNQHGGRRVVSAPTFDLVTPIVPISRPISANIDDVLCSYTPSLSHKASNQTLSRSASSMVLKTLPDLPNELDLTRGKSNGNSVTNIISIYQEFSPVNNFQKEYLKEPEIELLAPVISNDIEEELSGSDISSNLESDSESSEVGSSVVDSESSIPSSDSYTSISENTDDFEKPLPVCPSQMKELPPSPADQLEFPNAPERPLTPKSLPQIPIEPPSILKTLPPTPKTLPLTPEVLSPASSIDRPQSPVDILLSPIPEPISPVSEAKSLIIEQASPVVEAELEKIEADPLSPLVPPSSVLLNSQPEPVNVAQTKRAHKRQTSCPQIQMASRLMAHPSMLHPQAPVGYPPMFYHPMPYSQGQAPMPYPMPYPQQYSQPYPQAQMPYPPAFIPYHSVESAPRPQRTHGSILMNGAPLPTPSHRPPKEIVSEPIIHNSEPVSPPARVPRPPPAAQVLHSTVAKQVPTSVAPNHSAQSSQYSNQSSQQVHPSAQEPVMHQEKPLPPLKPQPQQQMQKQLQVLPQPQPQQSRPYIHIRANTQPAIQQPQSQGPREIGLPRPRPQSIAIQPVPIKSSVPRPQTIAAQSTPMMKRRTIFSNLNQQNTIPVQRQTATRTSTQVRSISSPVNYDQFIRMKQTY